MAFPSRPQILNGFILTTDVECGPASPSLLIHRQRWDVIVSNSLKLAHVKRYKDIAVLLIKYGRSDVVTEAGWNGDIHHHAANARTPAKAAALATDLEAMG